MSNLRNGEESCAVIFFITSSFKDEGFLETEINYAIRERRRKGEDKFKIIPLQFIDSEGKGGEIPALLGQFAWKTPKTHLEALREIVRALPIAPGSVDWREGITGVVTKPKTKSTSAPLSEEAKAILKAAATGDGYILYSRTMGGDSLSAGGHDLLPDRDERTVAQWMGGLEDLQRRRYVKDDGHKGEVFRVTREGYEAADKLLEAEDE